jgi:hypothetical protein
MRELKQLVSKKHLDYDNLSMLSDFLVKHPSVLLKDTSLSNRYKGQAYNCLAELLKFLQTHSVNGWMMSKSALCFLAYKSLKMHCKNCWTRNTS